MPHAHHPRVAVAVRLIAAVARAPRGLHARVRRAAVAARVTAAALAGLAALALPAAALATPGSAARSAAAFTSLRARPAAAPAGAAAQVRPPRLRAFALDRRALAGVLAGAPAERTRAARERPLTLSLPAPDGGFERFAVRRSSVMEPGLAARHPEIATYRGSGIDDPRATVALDLTPAGLHAAVRAPGGAWYVDPYARRDQSVYVSYRRGDVAGTRGGLHEPEVVVPDTPLRRARDVAAAPGDLVSLRTYRLALVSDPAYATYHGAANVTAAKVTLVNRVNQIYEDDLGIHLELVAGNDQLNLNTAALMTGANGPCGAAACYTSAEAAGCDVATVDKTDVVIGQILPGGASSYDIGHIGLGLDGGGIAYVGVVGAGHKGGGCTGVDQPVGDLFAVDYVAHEMGHQFGGDHTFNGVTGNCTSNRSPGASVEPGSGVTVMAYAGICGTDDLQPHSDPYFSQFSIGEVTSYVAAATFAFSEVQTVSLRDFSGSDAFRLTYNGQQSAPIVRGSNYTAAGIKSAIQGIGGFPGTVTVTRWASTSSALDDTGFTVYFGGGLAGTDAQLLGLANLTGVTGFAGETSQGGPSRNGGTVTPTANHSPVVTAPAGFTIPIRTPFSLTGSATDADGDALTYMWEQSDAGGASGTGLVSNSKPDGPLFRVFGTAANVTPAGTITSPSPGENAAGASPTRVFPDLAQVLAGTTNAATATCPAAGAAPVAPAIVECYSEFLPTAGYGPVALHFRLTARDSHAGAGGVSQAATTLTLAKSAGPFRVTSQAAPFTVESGTLLPVTWSVAGTSAPPVSAANVRITLSTDGGLTYPKVLAASTPNDGSQAVLLPNADTAQARVKIEAVGNVFFDVNHASFTITPGAPVVAGSSASVQYTDALAPAVIVGASDENTQGSSLTASATGLPAGLVLAIDATSPGAGAPGGRTWTIDGQTTAAPGTYPVEVLVNDGAGHAGVAAFDLVVEPEDAVVTYTGDARVTGAPGAATAPAHLSASVLDSSLAPAPSDATAGDVATASVAFMEGATVLCAAVPVVTAGNPGSGSADCTASLTVGSTHHVTAVAGGRYTGTGTGDVQADAAPTPAPPPPAITPPPPAITPPPISPLPPAPAATLAPDLSRTATALRMSPTGRVRLVLRCRRVGSGTPPRRCAGSVRLTAAIGGRRRTIATATFSFARTVTKVITVRLGALARRVIRSPRAARLAMTTSSGRRATKTVRILPPRR